MVVVGCKKKVGFKSGPFQDPKELVRVLESSVSLLRSAQCSIIQLPF